MSKPEQRFKEGSGERFLANSDKIRCHGLSKTKIREYREQFNDYTTPTDELWPECQCGKSACENQYVCRFHGGKSPRTKSPPRTILDVLPVDMAEKYQAIMDSPDYISRKEDINLIRVRIRSLLEELQDEADSKEAWGLVHEALVKLKGGDLMNAIDFIERAVTATDRKEKIWKEIYQTEKLLGDLTTTQMKTVKDLQSMATVEQVNALVATIINIIDSGSKSYITDTMQRSQFMNMFVAEMNKLLGTTPQKMIIDAAKHTDN